VSHKETIAAAIEFMDMVQGYATQHSVSLLSIGQDYSAGKMSTLIAIAMETRQVLEGKEKDPETDQHESLEERAVHYPDILTDKTCCGAEICDGLRLAGNLKSITCKWCLKAVQSLFDENQRLLKTNQ